MIRLSVVNVPISVTSLVGFSLCRGFSTFPVLAIKGHKLPPRPKIIENEIQEAFMKGGRGPGGQKINKTNSKVQLKHIPTGIVVTCQATRSQDQNRKIAREILAMKVQHTLDPENSRQTIVEEWKSKKTYSKRKKAKRKYKKLEEDKKKAEEGLHDTAIEGAHDSAAESTSNAKTTTLEAAQSQTKTPVSDASTNTIMNSVD